MVAWFMLKYSQSTLFSLTLNRRSRARTECMKGERNEKALKLGYIGFQGRRGCRRIARTQLLFGWLGHEEKGQGTGGRCVLTS